MDCKLRNELERVHLIYIKHEECPSKMELKFQLQGLCEKWLSCTPHSSKFILSELPDILRTSLLHCQANTNQEVALEEVAKAFLALAKYASNIVAQPWRQEFHTIKPYGGYYLQEVGLVLSDIEKLMAFIGYQSSDDNNVFTLNIEFSPTVVLQKLPRVALDYLLVALECQLMSRILGAVNTSDVTVDLYKLLEYRKYHVGTWQVTVQGLMYEARYLNFAAQQSSMDRRSQGPPSSHLPANCTQAQQQPSSSPNPVHPGLIAPHLPSNYNPQPSSYSSRNPVPPGLMSDSTLPSNHNAALQSSYSSQNPVPAGLLSDATLPSNHNSALPQIKYHPISGYPIPPSLVNLKPPSFDYDEDKPLSEILYEMYRYKVFGPPVLPFVPNVYPQEQPEDCPHGNLESSGCTDYKREENEIYMNSALPQSLAEPLLPQQVKWHARPESSGTLGHTPRSYASALEPSAGMRESSGTLGHAPRSYASSLEPSTGMRESSGTLGHAPRSSASTLEPSTGMRESSGTLGHAPRSYASSLEPSTGMRESSGTLGHTPRSYASALEPSAGMRGEEIFYSDQEEEEQGEDVISIEPRRSYSSVVRKEKQIESRVSWSKLGEAQLLAHNTPQRQAQQSCPQKKHTQNRLQAPAKSHSSEPHGKSKRSASKSADSRDESWEYVFSKLEIQSPSDEESDSDREKVAKTVTALQLSAPPQLLGTANEIYNRPNELDNRRYQEYIRHAPQIDGVIQHPIVNMSWPERYKYLYFRGEREALVGYMELLTSALEASKVAKSPSTETSEVAKQPAATETASKGPTWSCQTCTWVNANIKTICSMCNKTRNVASAAEPANPGPQCSQCTLVNPTGRDYCEACGASLDLLYI